MKNSIKKLIFIVFVLFMPLAAREAFAQSLYFSPDKVSLQTGMTFTIKLKLDSGGSTINVAQATVHFQPDVLEVRSISKTGSIFTMWPEQPSYSNSLGTINFSGGLPSPGFVGTGTIISVDFRTKKSGDAKLSISGGVILAADGRGTNILSHISEAAYEIAPGTKNITTKNAANISGTNVPGVANGENIVQGSVDAIPPEPFEIVIDNQGDLTLPTPFILLDAKDNLSGIKEFELQIDEGDIFSVSLEKANPFTMPFQRTGSHELRAWAVDNAGNRRESNASFYIKSIQPPEILIYPKTYNSGEEMMYIEGKAVPGFSIDVFLEKENSRKIWKAVSDKDGNWSVLTNELLNDGVYDLSARATDRRGATSDLSSKYQMSVVLSGFSLGSHLVTFKSAARLMFLLMIAVVLITTYIYIRIRSHKKKLQKETIEAQRKLKKAFIELKKKLEKKIEYLDSRPGLNAREKKMRDEIFNLLKDSERTIYQEIKDIEDEV